jgi:hypothetical protein
MCNNFHSILTLKTFPFIVYDIVGYRSRYRYVYQIDIIKSQLGVKEAKGREQIFSVERKKKIIFKFYMNDAENINFIFK